LLLSRVDHAAQQEVQQEAYGWARSTPATLTLESDFSLFKGISVRALPVPQSAPCDVLSPLEFKLEARTLYCCSHSLKKSHDWVLGRLCLQIYWQARCVVLDSVRMASL